MKNVASVREQLFRLWIASYSGAWRPLHWNQQPPRAIALEPVEDSLYTADEAAMFLAGFNGAILGADERLWAVAVPITIRYEGDVQPGMPIHGHVFPALPEDRNAEDRNQERSTRST